MSDQLPPPGKIPRVVFGVPLDPVTNDEALTLSIEATKSPTPLFFATANLDFATQAETDVDLRRMLFTADLVVADGMPLVWASRWLGGALPERVAGSDLVPQLLEGCARESVPVYFFGSDDVTLAESSRLLEARYPGLKVAGYESPPIGNPGHWDHAAIVQRIKDSGARVLLVALGCPKQERWLFGNLRETGVGLGIGIGASLDFISGKQTRAPRWMQKTGLEWVWRMGTNPRRLAGRYWKDFRFLVRAFRRQRAGWNRSRRMATEPNSCLPETPAGEQVSRHPDLSPDLSTESTVFRNLRGAEVLLGSKLDDWKPEGRPERAVLIDLSVTGSLDCVDLGRIAGIFRSCRQSGRSLALGALSPAARAAFAGSLMEGVFPVVSNGVEAQEWVDRLYDDPAKSLQSAVSEDGEIRIGLDGPFDVTTYDDVMEGIERSIPIEAVVERVVLDVSKVSFLDSRAVGGLLRLARRLRAEKDAAVVLSNPSPEVEGTIRLMRLDEVLGVEWADGS